MLVASFDLCTGCRTCELACSFHKEGGYNPAFARLKVVGTEDGLWCDVVTCAQCENAACLRVCPHGAISRHAETGAVVLDAEACKACGLCERYCHRGIVRAGPGQRRPAKCDLCPEAGDTPPCVEQCPTGALFVVTVPPRAAQEATL
jgi:anaerobic carbon-monoxide dehydrogenase iron sulfur subunit